MTDPIDIARPERKLAMAKTSWFWVPAIENLSAPTDLEINALSAINATFYMTAEQEDLTPNSEKVTLPRLAYEISAPESVGATTYSLPDRTFIWDPQGEPNSVGVKMWEALGHGPEGNLVRLQSVDAATLEQVAAGSYVDVLHVKIGAVTPTTSSNDAAGIYTLTASVGVLGYRFHVPVSAAA